MELMNCRNKILRGSLGMEYFFGHLLRITMNSVVSRNQLNRAMATTLPPPDPLQSKSEIFNSVESYLKTLNLRIKSTDQSRPWGGFFVLQEGDAIAFARQFFDDLPWNGNEPLGSLSPKFLLVAPQQRLSWQYHSRRAELWKLISGTAGIVRSNTDVQQAVRPMEIGETVKLDCGERHRLVGLNNWGIVAEIWQHTDPANPSDESDIVRLQDDFGR